MIRLFCITLPFALVVRACTSFPWRGVASGRTLPDHTKIICGEACAQRNALACLYFVFSYALGRRSQGRIITHIGCHKSVDNLTVSIATCHLM